MRTLYNLNKASKKLIPLQGDLTMASDRSVSNRSELFLVSSNYAVQCTQGCVVMPTGSKHPHIRQLGPKVPI